MKNWKQINSSPFKKNLTIFKSDKKTWFYCIQKHILMRLLYPTIYQFKKKMYISIRI